MFSAEFSNHVFPGKRLSGVLIFIFMASLLVAQSNDGKDFIIKNSGEIVVGKLIVQGPMKNSRKCRFQTEKSKAEVYKPFEIAGYRFENGKYYVSKNVNTADGLKPVFAEYLVKGKKDLFYLRDRGGDHFLIQTDDSLLVEIPYESRETSIDNRTYNYKSTRHIGFLETYFADCPQLSAKIEAIEEPGFENLTALTKEYHDIVCGENSCVVFKKEKMPVRFGFEPRIEFTSLFEKNGVYRPQYGGLVSLWLPEANQNIYAKTGFYYSEAKTENLRYYKVPLKFEYLFNGFTIRPKLNAGLNFYAISGQDYSLGNGLAIVAGGGFLAKLARNCYLTVDLESDVVFLSLESDFLNSLTFGTGLFFQF